MSFIAPKEIYDISAAFKEVPNTTREEKAELVLADGSTKSITFSKDSIWNKLLWWLGLSVCVKTKEGEDGKNLYIWKDTAKTLIRECNLPVDETVQKSVTRQFAKLIKMTINEELPQQQTPDKINKPDAIKIANNIGKVDSEKLKQIKQSPTYELSPGFLYIDIDKFVAEFKGKTIKEAKQKLITDYGVKEDEVNNIFNKALPKKNVLSKLKNENGEFFDDLHMQLAISKLNNDEIDTLAQLIKDNPNTNIFTKDVTNQFKIKINYYKDSTKNFNRLYTKLQELGVDLRKI